MLSPERYQDERTGVWYFRPRLKILPSDAYTLALDTTRALGFSSLQALVRLRCAWSDCPGDFGLVAYLDIGLIADMHDRFWMYFAPRGWKKEGDRWERSGRATAQERRSAPPIGHTPHGGSGDWNAGLSLRPYDLPGEGEGLDDDTPLWIRCHHSGHLHRVTIADVRASLDERCTTC